MTEASIRYKISRKTIHKWKKRYDGSIESLKDRSRAPHHVARKQTSAELTLVKRYAKKYAGDLLLGYESALNSGYERSYGCFKRTAAKLVTPSKKRKSSRKNKPYQRAEYPGQKVQMDVKFVPSYCVVNGEKYYQKMNAAVGLTGKCMRNTAQPVQKIFWKSWFRKRLFRSGLSRILCKRSPRV